MNGTTKKGKKKPGRKRIVIDWEQVERLAMIFCTQEEIAYVMGVSVDTLQRRKEFAVTYKKGREKGKISLRRAQYKRAMDGNTTMQIWLGKQYLGQTDKLEQTIYDQNFDVELVHEDKN